MLIDGEAEANGLNSVGIKVLYLFHINKSYLGQSAEYLKNCYISYKFSNSSDFSKTVNDRYIGNIEITNPHLGSLWNPKTTNYIMYYIKKYITLIGM